MRRLFFKWMVLMVPIGLFLVWFDLARGDRESNQFLVKRERLTRAASRIEVLFLGSSHENEGIVSELIHSNAFNLAAVSQSIRYDVALVRYFVPMLPRLKMVVLPISYFSMDYELAGSTEGWRTFYYRHYYGLPHSDWRQETLLRNWSSWFLFGSDFGLAAIRGFQPPLIHDEYNELGTRLDVRPPAERTLHPKPDYVRTAAKSIMRRHNGMMHPENFAVHAAALHELMHELDARGIRVVFITLPVSKDYYELQNPEARSRTEAAIQELCREFGTEWKNYSTDSRFVEEDFWDSDHLNFNGAKKFSRILGEEFIRPKLESIKAR